MSAPRDAATILLLRAAGEVPFEIFMVKRSRRSRFMADAMVFPGGRLDAPDRGDAIAARCDLDRAAASARLFEPDGAKALGLLVAGVRETFEEAGVLLAERAGGGTPEAAELRRWRGRLNDRGDPAGLTEMAEALDLRLRVAALGYLAHWVTPEIEARRYDARFLVTVSPPGQRPEHDRLETTESAWLSPGAALDAYDRAEIWLAPPTLRILQGLRDVPDLATAINLRGGVEPPQITPQAHFEGPLLHLVLPGDTRYDPPGTGCERVSLVEGCWVSRGALF